MRWDQLFDDLEAQFDAEARHDLSLEVADRTRRERALRSLQGRLLAARGHVAHLRHRCGAVQGGIADVGPDWVLLDQPGDQTVLLPFSAVIAIRGLGSASGEPGAVARTFDLGLVLRGLSRDRARVELTDVTGAVTSGTVDAVGSDHLDLAVHPVDQPRRRENVTGHDVVPFTAICAIRRR